MNSHTCMYPQTCQPLHTDFFYTFTACKRWQIRLHTHTHTHILFHRQPTHTSSLFKQKCIQAHMDTHRYAFTHGHTHMLRGKDSFTGIWRRNVLQESPPCRTERDPATAKVFRENFISCACRARPVHLNISSKQHRQNSPHWRGIILNPLQFKDTVSWDYGHRGNVSWTDDHIGLLHLRTHWFTIL